MATSTAAFLGETARGPTKPRLISSYDRLIAEIDIALVRPAEFIIFRVVQKTQEPTG